MTLKSSDLNNFYIGFPKSFQEIKYYGSELLAGQAVIINLSALPEEEQEKCRLFISGVVFAIKGKLEEISFDVLLAIPSQMEIATEHFYSEDFSSI